MLSDATDGCALCKSNTNRLFCYTIRTGPQSIAQFVSLSLSTLGHHCLGGGNGTAGPARLPCQCGVEESGKTLTSGAQDRTQPRSGRRHDLPCFRPQVRAVTALRQLGRSVSRYNPVIPMEPFDWIIDEVATTLGGPPGSHRWEIVTACFGWGAAGSLALGFLLSFLRYKSLAAYAISVFSALIWIALKRDYKKIKSRPPGQSQ
jgi:hypothetical protein